MTILQQLKEYFENTPKEQIKEDWESLSDWCNVGPNLEDFLEEINENREVDTFFNNNNIEQDEFKDFHRFNRGKSGSSSL